MRGLYAVASLVAVAVAAPAFAGVIDFNDNSDGVYWTPTVQSDGFTATENNMEYGGWMTPMGTNVAVDGWGPSNGTVHLDSWTNESSDSVWTLTQTDGQAFSLSAFDFASGYPDSWGTVSQLTLTGALFGGGTVTQVITPTSQYFTTYAVDAGFTNLLSVTFDAYGENNRAAYDNIVVNGGSNGAVPEPASWALMLGGFGLVGGAMRARRKQTALSFG